MNLTRKAIIIAALMLLSTLLAGLAAREWVLNPGLFEIERQADLRDIERLKLGLDRFRQTLESRTNRITAIAGVIRTSALNQDWRPAMVDVAKISGYNDLSYVVLSDPTGANAVLLSSELSDTLDAPPAPATLDELLEHIIARLPETLGASRSGYFLSQYDGPLIYTASRASWNDDGLPQVFIAVRRLDDTTIAEFGHLAGLSIEKIGDRRAFDAAVKRDRTTPLQRSNHSTLYATLRDDLDRDMLFLKFNTAPRAFDTGLSSPTIVAAFGFALACWIIVLVLAYRSFIRPLRRITRTLRLVRENKNYRQTLSYAYRDELGELVRECNALLQHVASHTEELETYSYTDALTGIGNRRLFQEQLDYQCKIARRNGHNLTAILFDLDYFKQYNDFYGHEGGDQALRHFAHLLRDVFSRKTDIVARTGGEEFTVVTANTQMQSAKELAERVVKSLRAQKIPHRGNPRSGLLSVSAGLYSMIPCNDQAENDLLRRADEALYLAKHNGRDQLVVFADASPELTG